MHIHMIDCPPGRQPVLNRRSNSYTATFAGLESQVSKKRLYARFVDMRFPRTTVASWNNDPIARVSLSSNTATDKQLLMCYYF
jgi:hypothetical protein